MLQKPSQQMILLIVTTLLGGVAILLNSNIALSVFIVAAVMYSVMYAVNTINQITQNTKELQKMQAEIRDIHKELSSTNSKLNLAIPDAKRSFNRG